MGTATDILSREHGLNEDQMELLSVAEKFAENEMAPFAAEWDAKKHFPRDVLRNAAEIGFGGLFVDDAFGGTGLGRLDGAIVFEALAGACTSTTAYLTIHNMCLGLLDKFGSDAQKAAWLPDLCSMQHCASYCLTEPNAGSDAASLRTSARRDGGDFVLNGEKAFISGGGESDVHLVMARTGDAGAGGVSCFIVPKDAKGLSFGAQEKKMGWNTQPTAAVVMEDCRVPAENLLGGEGNGFRMAMAALDGGRINIGACSVGAAHTCLSLARDHVGVREQFGKPLAAHQSVQFKLADMATDLLTARSAVRSAAAALDAKDPHATTRAAMAKRVATDLGFGVCNEALQLHGGYGYLQSYPVERFLRDVRVHQILEGTNEIMRVIISRAVLNPH